MRFLVYSNEFKEHLFNELQHLKAVLQNAPATAGEINTHESWCLIQQDESAALPAWANCVWSDVQTLKIESITDAQKKLREISRHWNYFGTNLHRRGSLIAEKLVRREQIQPQDFTKYAGLKPLQNIFPVFTLQDANTILYSQKFSRPTPDGKIPMLEDKENPPSRAYLKLWEAFANIGDWPKAGERVVDLGSSPGSWTWALANLGAHVTSIDRSPLAAGIAQNPLVSFQTGDAFSLKYQKMDWVCSDVICYPEKLYEYVAGWLNSGLCNKFVCSIKFQGVPDPAILDRFRALPNSRVLHLLHNKHEVTFISHPNDMRSTTIIVTDK